MIFATLRPGLHIAPLDYIASPTTRYREHDTAADGRLMLLAGIGLLQVFRLQHVGHGARCRPYHDYSPIE